MYNGIGLQTPRGSGTNGHVQRNWAFVRSGKKDSVTYKTEDDLAKLDAASNRPPNQEILAHERKRQLEVKCAEYEAALENTKSCTKEEITAKVNEYRVKLMGQGKVDIAKDEYGRITVRDTHQIAEAQQEKNAKLREAFGISEYFVEGSSFDPDRKAKEDLVKSAALQQEIQANKDVEMDNGKNYALVHSPSVDRNNSDDDGEKEKSNSSRKKKKKKHHETSRDKKKKAKREKKERKYKSKRSKKTKNDHSDDDSNDDLSDAEVRKHRKSKKDKKSRSKKKKRGDSHDSDKSFAKNHGSSSHAKKMSSPHDQETIKDKQQSFAKSYYQERSTSPSRPKSIKEPHRSRSRKRIGNRSPSLKPNSSLDNTNNYLKSSPSKSLNRSSIGNKHQRSTYQDIPRSTTPKRIDRKLSNIRRRSLTPKEIEEKRSKLSSSNDDQRRRSFVSKKDDKTNSISPKQNYDRHNKRDKKRSRSNNRTLKRRSPSKSPNSCKRSTTPTTKIDRLMCEQKTQSNSGQNNRSIPNQSDKQNSKFSRSLISEEKRNNAINERSHSPNHQEKLKLKKSTENDYAEKQSTRKVDNYRNKSLALLQRSSSPGRFFPANKTQQKSTSHSPSDSNSSRLSYSPARRHPERYKDIAAHKMPTSNDRQTSSKKLYDGGRGRASNASTTDIKDSKLANKVECQKKPQTFVSHLASMESESDVEHSDDTLKPNRYDIQKDDDIIKALSGIAAKAKEKIKTMSVPSMAPAMGDYNTPPLSIALISKTLTEPLIPPRKMVTTANITATSSVGHLDNKNLDFIRKQPKDAEKSLTIDELKMKSQPDAVDIIKQHNNDENHDNVKKVAKQKQHSRSRSRYSSASSNSSDSSRSSSRSSISRSSHSGSSSRSRSSRSPSIPRRRGSPSFLDRRRITS